LVSAIAAAINAPAMMMAKGVIMICIALPHLRYGTTQTLPQSVGVCLSTPCCFAI
jgi:hypothetical protein